jgi:hypothetical protein
MAQATTRLVFRDTWHVKALLFILWASLILHLYVFSTGRYGLASMIVFLLLTFLLGTVHLKSPSFNSLSVYYVAVAGYALGTSLTDLLSYANQGRSGKVVEELIDVHLYGLLVYLLLAKGRYIIEPTELEGK